MLSRLGGAGLILALGMCSAWAQELYRLEANDRVEVWSPAEPSLQRTAVIGPDGWLALPLVGHVKAAGLSAPDLEHLLQEKLKGFFKETVDITVMLQPREESAQTVYVSGTVATPGSYPFRPGMILLHGISMAGGLRTGAEAGSDEQRIVETRGAIARQTARLEALDAQVARVSAEIAGEDLPPAKADEPQAIARERRVLAARQAEEAALRRARDEASELRRNSAQAIAQQADTQTERIALAERRLEAISKLVAKGFANEAQQLELQGSLAEMRARLLALQVERLDAEREAGADVASAEARLQERRTGMEVELRDAERAQADAKSELADNKRVLKLLIEGNDVPTEEVTGPTRLSIIRNVNGKPTEFEADELTEIQPGDLIRVGPAPQMATTEVSDAGPAQRTVSQ